MMNMKAMILFTLLCLPAISAAGTLSWMAEERWVTVSKVYDGDTFKTRRGEKIRFLGLNTPETRHGDEPGQVGGKQAKVALTKLILGKQVRLRFDKEKKDRYKRTLAQVWMRDGLWVNGWLMRQGYAHVYTFEPNSRWAKKLLQEERIARAEKLGIWGTARFQLMNSRHISNKSIGQFRVVQGVVGQRADKKGWGFKLGKLNISTPKSYRKFFKGPPNLKKGQKVIVRGKIRISSKERLFLSLHSPTDLELR
ncbi:MAG: thermonuclease family protein [Mariprofundaceae bacterium]|nr:thermonuclease family protein [Mariprofundaceae bacterium]